MDLNPKTIELHMEQLIDIDTIKRGWYLNGHFSSFILIIFSWFQSWAQGKLKTINIGPFVGAAVKSNDSGPELRRDSGLIVWVAVPVTGLLMRRHEVPAAGDCEAGE